MCGIVGAASTRDVVDVLIEGIKKGHAAIVHAFLAKGASANARDAKGGPALRGARLPSAHALIAGGVSPDQITTAGRGEADVEILRVGGRGEQRDPAHCVVGGEIRHGVVPLEHEPLGRDVDEP